MSADGPIQGNNDFDGEICDMRRALTLEQAAADPDGDYFLEESELVSYAVPTPDGTPTMPSDEYYDYVFEKWDKDVSGVDFDHLNIGIDIYPKFTPVLKPEYQ